MSESRLENADYTVDFLDKIGGTEVLADPQTRKEFILGLDYTGFRGWLVRLNGMSRGVPVGERGIDGISVEVPTLMPPEPEDKEPLLEATLHSAQSILSREGNEAEDSSLEDVSLLFSGAINYIHPFSDGNGRTSRVAGFLTKEGYDGSDEAKQRLKAVMGDKGRNAFQNNPGDLTRWLDAKVLKARKPEGVSNWPIRVMPDKFADEPLGEAAIHNLGPEAQIKAEKVIRDGDFGDLAATKIMFERGLLPEGTDFGDKKFAWVKPDKYFAKFTDEDVEAVMQESRSMRRERVLTYIDAIENPDSLQIHLTEDTDSTRFQERDTTLHDYYAEYVKEYSSLYTERNPYQRRSDQRLGNVAVSNSQR